MKTPVLFISHGAPTFELGAGALGPTADTDEVITVGGDMTYDVLSMHSYSYGVNSLHRTSPLPDRDRSTQQRNHLSDAEIAAICHPLQFTSPRVRP